MQETIERIRQMELYFDTLQKALNENPYAFQKDTSLKEMLKVLIQYYEGGQWLSDYEMDEKGVLPQNLKRGVLSQDALYVFIERTETNQL